MNGLDAALDRLLGHLPVPPPSPDLAARILAEAQRPDREPLVPPAPVRTGGAGRRRWARQRWWLGVASINLALVGAAAASIEVAHHGLQRIAALPAALFHPHHAAPRPAHPRIVAHGAAPVAHAPPIGPLDPLPPTRPPIERPALVAAPVRAIAAMPHPDRGPPIVARVRHENPFAMRMAHVRGEHSHGRLAEPPHHATPERALHADTATAAANRSEAARFTPPPRAETERAEPGRFGQRGMAGDRPFAQRGWWWRQRQMGAQRQPGQQLREPRQQPRANAEGRPGGKHGGWFHRFGRRGGR